MPDQVLELAKIHLDEFRYRHELFWKLFYLFSFAILILVAIPFLYLDKVDPGSTTLVKVQARILFFPLSAMIVATISWCILRAEYERLHAAMHVYESALRRMLAEAQLPTRDNMIDRKFNFRIGVVVPNAMFIASLILVCYEYWVLRGK
jgi:hypothetical protein